MITVQRCAVPGVYAASFDTRGLGTERRSGAVYDPCPLFAAALACRVALVEMGAAPSSRSARTRPGPRPEIPASRAARRKHPRGGVQRVVFRPSAAGLGPRLEGGAA